MIDRIKSFQKTFLNNHYKQRLKKQILKPNFGIKIVNYSYT